MKTNIFDIDNWREIGATLARNKTRTFLTAFGIFWGTAMLAMLWGGGQGMRGMMMSNFEGFATNSGVLFPGRTTMPYRGYQKGMSWSMTQTDIDLMRRTIPEAEAFSPIISYSSTTKYKDRSKSTNMMGVDDRFADINVPVIRQGRFINNTDVATDRKVCVLGKNVAAELFGADSPIGQFVEVDKVFYRVVGVVSQRSQASIGGDLAESIAVPISTMRRTYNMGDRIHFALFVCRDGHTPSEIRPKIERALRANHPIHPDDHNAIWFEDLSEMFKTIGSVFTGINVLLLFVGFSSLLAGIIGVGNIMWIVVKERTKEFGIRRAIGARPRQVLVQILSESAVLTVIAGVAGICFAVGIQYIASGAVTEGSGMPADFLLSFGQAVTILILFIVLGSAAGAIPALKAMRIKPIEALNDK